MTESDRKETKKDPETDGEPEEHASREASQAHLPGEEDASISLDVEDAGIHCSRVLCTHSMFQIKVAFFCLYTYQMCVTRS